MDSQQLKIDNEFLMITLQEELGRLQQENILLKAAVKQLTQPKEETDTETK